jgi:hypothetical protein
MRLKHILYFLFSIYLLVSCNKKNVQLPLIEIDGIKEIQNHSSIWVFYELNEEGILAVLNKNNKLLNTHWIYNIDRRLTMDKIAPILEEMQENRIQKSMHKIEGMLNYFSYVNVVSQNISLLKFDPIYFIYQKKNIAVISKKNPEEPFIQLEITNDDSYIDHKRIDSDQLQYRLNSILSKDTLKSPKIILEYPGNLTYQNYLSVKALLSKLRLQVDKNEYIYTIK